MSQTALKTRASPAFDVARVRADFPILNLSFEGKPLVYLDNAASSQMPQQVIDRLVRYQTTQHANIHRAVHYAVRDRHRRIRRGAAQARALHQCARRARGDFHQRHHRSDQPGDARLRAQVHRRRRRNHPDHARAPFEHRALADAGRREGRDDPRRADQRRRRTADRRLREAVQRTHQAGRRGARVERARHGQSGRSR